jgi:ATP-binding cassette subfamily F protein 3
MLAKLERIDAVRADQSSGDFRLKSIERAGNHVLTVEDAALGYGENILARDISFILRRGECLGIIGPNGSGKTTFLKTILKKIPSLAGEIRWGSKVQIGYYAQQLDDLDDRNEIIMELRRVAPSSASAGELRTFLAKFLFTGDDVYKHVRDLSGGEKGRLALAKLIYSRVNVLVLDEPTNHLDIPSREALEEALDAYEGTIITISHDRYFLDKVATQILALHGEGTAEHYNGDYTEYHDWKAKALSPVIVARSQNGSARSRLTDDSGSSIANGSETDNTDFTREPRGNSVPPGRRAKGKSAPAVAGGSRRNKGKPDLGGSSRVKVVKKARAPETIELEISELEKRLADLSEEMAKPEVARDITVLVKLNDEYELTQSRLRELMEEWERAEATR